MADTSFDIVSDSPVCDDLMFWSIVGHEALSRPSSYELTVLSKNQKIDAKDILGRSFDVVIKFLDADGKSRERHCPGHAIRFVRVGQAGRYFRYEISLQSWFGLLSKRINSRWHQDELVLKVFESVLEDSAIKRIKKTETKHVRDPHESRFWTPQYQESDYQFLSRLMEDEGIYYWFDAHDAPGTMYLSDDSIAVGEALPVTDTLRCVPSGVSGAKYNEITEWISSRQLDSGSFASRDINYKQIRTKLSADKSDPDGHEVADLEVFEFTGGYFLNEQAERIAPLRMEELVTRRERHWAQTSWPDVTAGKNFIVADGPGGTHNGEYLIAACSFVVSHPGYEGISLKEQPRSIAEVLQDTLENDAVNAQVLTTYTEHIRSSPVLKTGVPGTRAFLVTALPLQTPYRAPRLTPKVTMPGPQSAIVVGAEGNEINADEYGRVKVQFHWDRYGTNDENSSCWVRVSHPWAGKGWGGYFIPRVGQEVIVDFLNGDPARPIIVGRVYNDDQPKPYESPTHSGFKTHSTPKGSPKNFNELRFEDRKGGEQVFVHAERRMDIRVKRNKYETVQGASQTLIGGGHALTMGGSLDLHVNENIFARSDGKVDFTLAANLSIGVGGASAQHARGVHELNARKITLEALTSIVLKVGSSFIEISPMGVAIVGPLVRINSGGAGPGTGPLDTEDPLDAAGADTGEPGYLDNLPRGGGGGRRKRHSDGYHARAVVRRPDGTFTYGGNGISVSGSPEHVDKTLQTLASLDGTPTGHTLIDQLQSNGHTVSIVENDANAAAGGGGMTNTTANGFPAGTNVIESDGIVRASDGSGADSVVNWAPGTNAPNTDASGKVNQQPDEALLGHELIHADHNGRGQNLKASPDPADATGNQEESRTIGINDHAGEPVSENNILRDLGEDWRRGDHDSTAVPAPAGP